MQLDQRLKGARLVVVDTETTGNRKDDPEGPSRICEVGIVLVEGLRVTRPRLVLQRLVNPERSITAGARRVHGLTDAQVRTGPTFGQLWPEIATLTQDALWVAYNVSFDHRLFSQECARIGASVPPVDEWLDPLKIVEVLDPKPHKLEAACARRKIRPGGHRAGSDALATALLLERVIAEAYLRGDLELPPPREPSARAFIAWTYGESPAASPSLLEGATAAEPSPRAARASSATPHPGDEPSPEYLDDPSLEDLDDKRRPGQPWRTGPTVRELKGQVAEAERLVEQAVALRGPLHAPPHTYVLKPDAPLSDLARIYEVLGHEGEPIVTASTYYDRSSAILTTRGTLERGFVLAPGQTHPEGVQNAIYLEGRVVYETVEDVVGRVHIDERGKLQIVPGGNTGTELSKLGDVLTVIRTPRAWAAEQVVRRALSELGRAMFALEKERKRILASRERARDRRRRKVAWRARQKAEALEAAKAAK